MSKHAGEKGTILIVDAVPDSMNGTLTALEQEGYLVTVTTNGEEALQQVGIELLDLILIDTALPETDGYEICRRFRMQKETSDIPIILMSGTPEGFDSAKAYDLGAVDYLIKPLKAEDLLARAGLYVTAKRLGKGLLEGKKHWEAKIAGGTESLARIHSVVEKEEAARKKAEEDLQWATANLLALEDISDAGILVTDNDGRMVSCNQKFIELWNIPEEAEASMSDERIMEAILGRLAEPDEFLERMKYLGEHPEEKLADEIRLATGLTFERTSAPIRNGENSTAGRLWHFRDISRQRLDEEKLKMANIELELLRNKVTQLDASVVRLKEYLAEEKRGTNVLQNSYDGLKSTVRDQAAQFDQSLARLRRELGEQ